LIDRELAKGRTVIVVAEGVNETVVKGLGESLPGTMEMLAEGLAERGIPWARIFGTGSKAAEIAKLQGGKVRVGLMTAKSGGTGVNLDDVVGSAPRTMLLMTPDFAADVFDQVLGRISRRNTASPAEVILMSATGSFSDARRGVILERKLRALRSIQEGTDPDRAKFETDEAGGAGGSGDNKARAPYRSLTRYSFGLKGDGSEFSESDFRPAVVAYAKDKWGDETAPDGSSVWRNFAEWFGDSKVVDKDGKPLVVYHGTTGERWAEGHSVFDTAANKEEPGTHFGTTDTANAFAHQRRHDRPYLEGSRVYPVHLSLRKPLVTHDMYGSLKDAKAGVTSALTREGATERAIASIGAAKNGRELADALIGLGYDGIQYRNYAEGWVDGKMPGSDSYIAFRPEQIKSATGNRGTFDGADSNIARAPHLTAAVELVGGDPVRAERLEAADRGEIPRSELTPAERVALPARHPAEELNRAFARPPVTGLPHQRTPALDAPPGASGEVERKAAMMRKILDIDPETWTVTGKIKGGPGAAPTAGEYDSQSGLAKLANNGDWHVAAHEMGHSLHDHRIGWQRLPTTDRGVLNDLLRAGRDLYRTRLPQAATLREGFAEVIRLRVTHPEALEAQYPRAHRWLDTWLDSQPDRLRDRLNEAAEAVRPWEDQGSISRVLGSMEGGSRKRGLVKIGQELVDPKTRRLGFTNIAHETYRQMFDASQGMQPLVDIGEKRLGRKLTAEENPREFSKVSMNKTQPIVASAITDGVPSQLGQRRTKGLSEIYHEAGGAAWPASKEWHDRLNLFDAYLYGRRALSVAERDLELAALDPRNQPRDTGITLDDATFVVERVEVLHPDWKRHGDEVRSWNEAWWEYLVDHDPSMREFAAALMSAENDYTTPLFRHITPDLKTHFTELAKALRNGSPIKRLGGSGRSIVEPRQSMRERAEGMATFAHQRSVMEPAIRLAEQEGPGGLAGHLIKVDMDVIAHEHGVREIIRAMEKATGRIVDL
ncbi:MAG TPA: hypothetical protein VFH61_12875, partial [Thermoleophilia bacterium]|nr:hypothetical protein [Thermoleophilia bacterium]